MENRLKKIGGNLDKASSSLRIFSNIVKNNNLVDAFRILYPNTKSVTWSGLGIGCRLDRFYINKLFKDNIVNCFILPCTHSDHDFVILKLKSECST